MLLLWHLGFETRLVHKYIYSVYFTDCPVPEYVLDDLHYLPGTTRSPPVPQKSTGSCQATSSLNPFTAATCQEPTGTSDGKQRYQTESAVSGEVCSDGEVVNVEGDDGLAEARCFACGADSEVNFNHLLFQGKICRLCKVCYIIKYDKLC